MSNGSGNNNLTVADVGPSYEVIQCRACDVIVGDSSEYLHHDPDSATITLRSALSVSIDNKKRFEYFFFIYIMFFLLPGALERDQLMFPRLSSTTCFLSPSPHCFSDNSAVFYNCSCTKCGALLGRVYRTTAAGQDHLRDTFTFDAVKLFASTAPFLSPFDCPSCRDMCLLAKRTCGVITVLMPSTSPKTLPTSRRPSTATSSLKSKRLTTFPCYLEFLLNPISHADATNDSDLPRAHSSAGGDGRE